MFSLVLPAKKSRVIYDSTVLNSDHQDRSYKKAAFSFPGWGGCRSAASNCCRAEMFENQKWAWF